MAQGLSRHSGGGGKVSVSPRQRWGNAQGGLWGKRNCETDRNTEWQWDFTWPIIQRWRKRSTSTDLNVTLGMYWEGWMRDWLGWEHPSRALDLHVLGSWHSQISPGMTDPLGPNCQPLSSLVLRMQGVKVGVQHSGISLWRCPTEVFSVYTLRTRTSYMWFQAPWCPSVPQLLSAHGPLDENSPCPLSGMRWL